MKKKNNLKLLLVANYFNTIGWALYSPMYALYVLHLGGTSLDVSMIWSAYALITGLLMLLFGKLETHKRYNPAIMLIVGYSLFIVVAVIMLGAKSIHHFYLSQLTLALAMGIMTPAAKATYMAAARRGQESGDWGLFDGGNYILGAAAAFTGGMLYKFGGFPAVFGLMIGLQTLSTLYALKNYRLMRPRPKRRRRVSDQSSSYA